VSADSPQTTRESLTAKHAAAVARRRAAPLGSQEFVRASEEVAGIEVAIARLEEPPPEETAGRAEQAAKPAEQAAKPTA
jgi:hypothetical protein